MTDYCVFCGAAMNAAWLCTSCGASPATSWPPSIRDAESDEQIRLQAAGNDDVVRPVTALFADVVGSTSLGERLEASEVKVLIGECVSRMTQVVETYGGVVRSFMGDGIAAFFGIEVAREDDAIRSALAALRILDVIAEYAEEISAAWDIPSVSVRVGINSGRVAIGLVGSAEPQLVALGDAVNVAARLQGTAEPGSIVVGPLTAAHLATRFEVERLGPLHIRGRVRKVDGWKLLRYTGEPTAGHLSSFVGRLHELQILDRALEDVGLGRGRIVFLVGEPGIGKSRLLSEYKARARSRVLWLQGRCAPQRVPRPYAPFVEILNHWLGIDSDTPQVISRVRLLARLRDALGDDAADVLPYLSQLLAVDGGESVVDEWRKANEQRGDAIRHAYASWIATLADERPIVVAIDDVEQADTSTKQLLEELYRLTTLVPLVIVLAMRNDPDATGWPVRVEALANHPRKTIELRLDVFDDVEAEEFVALKDADGLLTPALRCEIRVRAEGNPLYLEELTRGTLEVVASANPRAADACRELQVPVALENLLLARIDRVSVRARSVLQGAAVIGRRFPAWLLAATTNAVELGSSLEALVREGLIHEDGLAPSKYFAFRHGLYHEAVLATLTPERKRQFHEAVAKAMEESSPDQSLEEIAGHYLASRNERKALEYLERAGRRAAALSSVTEAAVLIEEARRLASKLADTGAEARLSALGAHLARELGRYDEARCFWEGVLAVSKDANERARTFLEIGRTEFDLGHADASVVACESGLAVNSDPGTRSDLLLLLAAIALRQGRFEATKNSLERADQVVSVPREIAREVQRLSLWAGYYASTGDVDVAEQYGQAAGLVVEGSDDLTLKLRAKRDMGIIHFLKGQLITAKQILAEVCEMALESGHVIRAQEAVSNLVAVHLQLGDLSGGLRIGLEALGWVQAPLWRGVVLSNLGQIEYELGLATARQRLVACLEILVEERDVARAFATLRLADMALRDGNIREAEVATEEVANDYVNSGRPDVQIKAFSGAASVALAAGRLDAAAQFVRQAKGLLDRSDRTEVPLVLRIAGLTHLRLGQDGEAINLLKRARDEARCMSMRLDEARALVLLGAADGSMKRQCFNEARGVFAECGSLLGLHDLRRATAGFLTA